MVQPIESARVQSLAGVVPCAGASTRMGRSKALLDAHGRSFVAAVVGTLRGCGCAPVIVVVACDADAERTEAEAAGATVLENPDPGEGPITSLRLALRHLGDAVDGVVYCPVDHPFVRPDTVAALVRALAGPEVPLALPIFGDRRGHPVALSGSLFGALLDPALKGGARTVVHRHLADARLVEVDDPGVVADIDTPDAYRDALAATRVRVPGRP